MRAFNTPAQFVASKRIDQAYVAYKTDIFRF